MDNYIQQFILLTHIKNNTPFGKNSKIEISKLLTKFRSKVIKYDKKKCEIVVAKYNENINWLNRYMHLVTIYDKSDNPIENSHILPNIGRETHTYLYHIINNWNNLADNTLFTQGSFSEDHRPFPIETYLIKKKNILFFTNFFCKGIKFRDNQFFLEYNSKWLNEYNNGEMKKTTLSFEQFWLLFNNEIKENFDDYEWSHGGIFSINKKLIKSKPLEYYINLYKLVSHHKNPEEGHYFERCWSSIFSYNFEYNLKIYNYYYYLDCLIQKKNITCVNNNNHKLSYNLTINQNKNQDINYFFNNNENDIPEKDYIDPSKNEQSIINPTSINKNEINNDYQKKIIPSTSTSNENDVVEKKYNHDSNNNYPNNDNNYNFSLELDYNESCNKIRYQNTNNLIEKKLVDSHNITEYPILKEIYKDNCINIRQIISDYKNEQFNLENIIKNYFYNA